MGVASRFAAPKHGLLAARNSVSPRRQVFDLGDDYVSM